MIIFYRDNSLIELNILIIDLQSEFVAVEIPSGDTDTIKQFAENEKKQRIEAEKELHLQVCCNLYGSLN